MPLSDLETLGALTEFLALADRLDMPESERQGILGVGEDDWKALASIRIDSAAIATPGFRRRLDYVLPLMRRAVANRIRPEFDRPDHRPPPSTVLS